MNVNDEVQDTLSLNMVPLHIGDCKLKESENTVEAERGSPPSPFP
jgi:hypothetical protein